MLKRIMTGLLFSTLAFAGNGSSGGGLIYGNQINPWFLENTKDVKYCVQISKDFSSLSKQRILELISESINFWKETFAEYNVDVSGEVDEAGISIKLGTQNFIYQDICSNEVDLVFNMGVLSEIEKNEIAYKQTIGLAKRTSYDEKNLRGRGYIYIAPENGELRPSASKMHKTPWSYGKNYSLKFALFHELGHIFGMQDEFSGGFNLMSANALEKLSSKELVVLLNKYDENVYRKMKPFGCGSRLDGDFEFNSVRNEISNLSVFLGLGKEFSLKLESSENLLNIRDTRNNKMVGWVNYLKNIQLNTIYTNAISMYFTKEQVVFNNFPQRLYDTYQPIYFKTVETGFAKEKLNLANGNSLEVFIKFDSDCRPTVGGIFENEIYFDLFGSI